MRATRFQLPLAVVMAAALAACGGDENVAAGSSPCLDDNVTCLSLRAAPGDVTYEALYFPGSDETEYYLSWAPANTRLRNFRPGQKVKLTITFGSPLLVTRNHATERVSIQAHFGVANGGSCGAATPTTTASISGDWKLAATTHQIESPCIGSALFCTVASYFVNLKTGEELQSFSVEFTVPDKFETLRDAGQPIPAVDLELTSIDVTTDIAGTPQPPPVWPKGEPLP